VVPSRDKFDRVAKRYGKPVIGIAGCLSTDVGVVHEHAIDAVFSVLSQICTRDVALAHAAKNVTAESLNIAATLKLARDMWA
jgi:glycerate kinase